MSSASDTLKDLPGFVGMASFTKPGLPIQEYGTRCIKHEVSGFCSVVTQIRNSLSSSIQSDEISITIETTKKKIIAVERNDVVLILYKNNVQETPLKNDDLESDVQEETASQNSHTDN
ncbi:hypothetical protein OIY81_3540 [Cryptosporidium canis]|uniref:Roadblock/LAMTOR2 domain-containing protein n=1 Tax=Cryptosporidium canis TaxID=195482 RepID=A0ABQ8P9V3_9CRYT|nr:hypothetical protein OIY81_3540 [Cryptosporidium canis]KAJ1613940.1 hypothetical protein OJ252_859 [Cryptosporidium canis]